MNPSNLVDPEDFANNEDPDPRIFVVPVTPADLMDHLDATYLKELEEPMEPVDLMKFVDIFDPLKLMNCMVL